MKNENQDEKIYEITTDRPEKKIENSILYQTRSPGDDESIEPDAEPPHSASLTSIAAEAMRTGLFPEKTFPKIPGGEDQIMQVGDPDVDPLENENNNEQIPGRDMSTPDQSNVDEIGRAYGIEDIDQEELTSLEELLEKRDAKRWELES